MKKNSDNLRGDFLTHTVEAELNFEFLESDHYIFQINNMGTEAFRLCP